MDRRQFVVSTAAFAGSMALALQFAALAAPVEDVSGAVNPLPWLPPLEGGLESSSHQPRRLKSYDCEAIRNRPGVIAAVPMTGIGAASGIAVVADTWWRAKTALDAMPVEWEPGPNGYKSTSDLISEYRAKAPTGGPLAVDEGDIAATGPIASILMPACAGRRFGGSWRTIEGDSVSSVGVRKGVALLGPDLRHSPSLAIYFLWAPGS